MRGGETNHDDKNPGKITSLDEHRKNGERQAEQDIFPDEGSLGELLIHMRRVREAVPVNERLREELRARLAGMQSEGVNQCQLTATASGTGAPQSIFQKMGLSRRPKYLWLFPTALLMVALYWLWWSVAAPKSLESGPDREISRFWLEESPLEFACEPQGRGFLAVRDGALLLLDQHGNQTGMVKPPRGQSYASPALTRSGDKLALIRRYDTGEEVITATMPAVPLEAGAAQLVETALAKAEVRLRVDQGKRLSGFAWSPDGQTLAYALGEPPGQSEVYLLAKGREPASLGMGRDPAWSPDGSRLVVERAGDAGQPELWLTGPGRVGEIRLAEGERPAWSSRGHLAFIKIKTTERVLTYSPDGSPLFTVQQRQGEIRTIDLGRKGDISLKQPEVHSLPGDRLLLAPEVKPGGDELNWLRRLEMEGVREPRTLLLEPLSNFQNIQFSPDGKTLLVARRDGGTVALVQVGLRERLTKRGEGQ